MIDGIAAYKYLVCEVGFLPQNITLGGDSAGGNIALAVTRYVVESHLPYSQPPGGLIAASPATDLYHTRAEITSSHHTNAASDIFDLPLRPRQRPAGRPHVGVYTGEMDPEEAKRDRYVCPTSKFVKPLHVGGDVKLFSGFPRTYIMGGGAEHLFDDIVALERMMKDDGVDVTTDFPPDAVHAYFVFGWHEPERTQSLVRCAAWLDGGHAATIVVE